MRSRRTIPAHFIRLTLGRLLPLGFLAPLSLLFVLAMFPENPGSSTLGPGDPEWVRDALAAARTRQAVWAVLLFFAGPLLVVGAARSAHHWSAVDADWFAPLPVPRGLWAALSNLGLGVAVFVLCLLTGVLAEVRTRSHADALRWTRTLEHPALSLVEGDPPARWTQSDALLSNAPPRSRLIARPSVAPGSGPGVTVRFSALLAGAEEIGRTARIFGRSRIELELLRSPDGPLELQLERLGKGAVCILPPRSIDLFEPVSSSRLASVALFLHSLIALAAWTVLAAGLGAWMRPSLATLLTLGLSTLPWWLSPGAPSAAHPWASWLSIAPGTRLLPAWHLVGDGYVPAGPTAGELLGALGLLMIGFALLKHGIARGRTLS